MTVSSTSRRAGPFTGNGVTTSVPFTFKVFEAADIEVTHTNTTTGVESVLTLNTHYSVAVNADQATSPGGTITYPLSGAALSATETITVVGATDYEQDLDVSNAGRFLPQAFEDALDKAVILIQQLKEKLGRALLFSVNDTGTDVTLPAAADRVGLYLSFDATGDPVASAGTGADAGLRTDLAAATGGTLLGFLQAGTQAVARTARAKMRDIIASADNAPAGDGVSNDGAKMRALFADAPAGSTVLVKAGTYLLDQDGANPYCLALAQRLHIIFEPGVTFKASTAGVRSVIQVSAAITHEGAPVIDGDNKANHAVEVVVGAKGTTFKKWEGKNVTQAHVTSFAAAVFSVVSEIGITFDDCYAHDAVSYPNGVEGDAYGAARGFHFYGTAPEFGVNAVVNSRADNIRNTNGLTGDYEDEDGIVSQMTGSEVLIENNALTNCMKRGIKVQDRGTIAKNRIITTRGGADNTLDGSTRMYSGISVYSSDVSVLDNKVASGTAVGLTDGGTFYYGLEIGLSGQLLSRVSVRGNRVLVGTDSNARAAEMVRLRGALQEFTLKGNTLAVAVGPTIAATTWGVRALFDHATERADVDISGNSVRNTTYSMLLTGGFTGTVSRNRAKDFQGGLGGIVVDASASALRPNNVLFYSNVGQGVDDYVVRINDTGAVGIGVYGTRTESLTVLPVLIAASIRACEESSFAPVYRPATIVAAAPPTTGTWVRGDRCMNRDPRDAAPVVEWRCQYGGTPGTWHAVSWITVKAATGSRPVLTASDQGVTYLDTSLAFPDPKPIWWDGTQWLDATGVAV